jgi:hypothetical protein
MCTVLLPPGVNPIAVNIYIIPYINIDKQFHPERHSSVKMPCIKETHYITERLETRLLFYLQRRREVNLNDQVQVMVIFPRREKPPQT